ncbi:MAG TPA: divergent polysaccharide deacetylase family protein, partial [Candidatus Saccharimonadales bacterium]|nr:divergent polysaccharide deacetylase family protein [Candidatus Saccharimonadales bacterium]
MGRRRSRSRFPLFRFAFTCIAITLAVLLAQRGYLFLKSDRGRAWVLVALRQERNPRAQELLTRAVRGSLKVVGATDRELRPAVDSDALVRWNLELPPTVSLTQADYTLSQAVDEAGGRVLDALETSGSKQDTLELRLGLGSEVTHRVVLVKPHRQPPKTLARLALLLEDVEPHRDALLSSFLGLGFPFSFGVLPLDGARRHCEAIRAAGGEVLLYLPMEGKSPAAAAGPAPAVLVDMRPDQVRQRVADNLADMTGAVGVVNYQGQLATQDPAVMRAVMEEVRRRGLFFVDAATTDRSAAQGAAVEVGAHCLEETVRLDAGGPSQAQLRERLEAAAAMAVRRGAAVAMGRITPELLDVLRTELPRLRARG